MEPVWGYHDFMISWCYCYRKIPNCLKCQCLAWPEALDPKVEKQCPKCGQWPQWSPDSNSAVKMEAIWGFVWTDSYGPMMWSMDDVWMLKKNCLKKWNCDRFLCDILEPQLGLDRLCNSTSMTAWPSPWTSPPGCEGEHVVGSLCRMTSAQGESPKPRANTIKYYKYPHTKVQEVWMSMLEDGL